MIMEKSDGVGRTIISKERLRKRVVDLGREISEDYKGLHPVVVSVLRGGMFFLTDLTRAISIPIHVDTLSIGRYPEGHSVSGAVKITKDLDILITGRHVIIAEDIVDTGLTLAYLTRILNNHKPESLHVCALLNNVARRFINLPLRYVGFNIPDIFVVGYGLDFNEDYRHLEYIAEYPLP